MQMNAFKMNYACRLECSGSLSMIGKPTVKDMAATERSRI